MKRFKKIFLFLLISIAVLILSAVILLKVYKKEINRSITENVKSSLGLDLKIDDIGLSIFGDWPHLTIKLKQVELSSALNKGPKETFLTAGSIFLSFNLRKLIHKELSIKHVSIKDARIMLRQKMDGSTNFEFKSPKKDSTQSASKVDFEINKVSLKNVGFTFVNEIRKQRLNFTFGNTNIQLKNVKEGFEADIKGQLHIGGLLFKSKKGPFFKNADVELNLYLIFNQKMQMLCIYPPSYLRIEKEDYHATALMDFKDKKQIVFIVKSKSASVFKVSKLLNTKIQKVLSNFHVTKPVEATALVGIPLGKREDPILIIDLKTENNEISIGESKVPYRNVAFKGRLISITKNKMNGYEEDAVVKFEPITGKVYDFPFTSSLTINNLVDPKLKFSANVLMEAEKIPFAIASKYNLKGTCLMKVDYSGPTEKLNKKEFLGPEMSLHAFLIFKNFSLQSKKNRHTFALNGNATLNKQDLSFTKMQFKTDGGSMLMTGKAENFTSYGLGLSNFLKANLDVQMTKFTLNPYFGDSKNNQSVSQSIPTKRKVEKRKKILNGGDEFSLHVKVAAKNLLVKKVEAKNANLILDYYNNTLYLRSIKMDVCEGYLQASGKVDDFEKLYAQVEISRVNVVKLFEQMDNFGQESIKSENLKGTIELSAAFESELDIDRNIIPASMLGEVKLKLKDGHLVNFEPMQNISNYVFKNRDFKDIYFSEINETLKMKAYSMKIEEMELASNVINMYISGVYRFKENSVINLLIPWNNLKRRERDHVPKVSGETAEDTRGLKLNFSGEAKKMKLSVGHKKADF